MNLKKLETIQNEAAEKIAKFERAANEAKELVATKENLLQRQKINREEDRRKFYELSELKHVKYKVRIY